MTPRQPRISRLSRKRVHINVAAVVIAALFVLFCSRGMLMGHGGGGTSVAYPPPVPRQKGRVSGVEPNTRPSTTPPPTAFTRMDPVTIGGEACRPFQRDAEQPPIDSTVLMLFDREDPASYSFAYDPQGWTPTSTPAPPAGASSSQCMRFTDEAFSQENFDRVAAAYLASPLASSSSAKPYYDFFEANQASFWVIDAHGAASPMTLDVVYTFVNPAAPSFQRHMRERGLRADLTDIRYTDWGELRYAFRSLRQNMLRSAALRQDHRRRAEDVATLRAMGYTVSEEVLEKMNATSSTTTPLVNRVHLVLSDGDQVPAWLDVAAFPELRIVTHAELFPAEDADNAGILPTLNSNVIESGLYRISNISRFFMYSNNDHMIGRQVSLFDLFRPLSPFRQALHLAAHQVRSNQQQQQQQQSSFPCVGTRRFAFLEPLLHSESCLQGCAYSPYERREESQSQVKACAALQRQHGELELSRYAADGSLNVPLVTQKGWQTKTAYVYAGARGRTHIPYGSGVAPPYTFYVITNLTDGISPWWGNAHLPLVLDRDSQRRMLEEDFRDITRETRLAYEREQHPYSMVETVAPYSAAKRRDALQADWQTVLLGNTTMHPLRASLLAQVEAALAHTVDKRRQMANESAPSNDNMQDASFETCVVGLGPLYGNTWSARLQAPDAVEELSLWWLPDARPPPPISISNVRQLRPLYRVPEIRVQGETTRYVERFDNAFAALYHDIFHHPDRYMGTDLTYRFNMVFTAAMADGIASELKERPLPLWIGLNDNIRVLGANENLRRATNQSFARLLQVATGNAPAAPWEK